MLNPENWLAALVGDLKAQQKTVVIARCVELWLGWRSYRSPLLSPHQNVEECKRIVGKLASNKLSDLAELSAANLAQVLQDARSEQAGAVAKQEDHADEMRYHDDGWISGANTDRMKSGQHIIEWLIAIEREDWACPGDTSPFGPHHHFVDRDIVTQFQSLRAQMIAKGELVIPAA